MNAPAVDVTAQPAVSRARSARNWAETHDLALAWTTAFILGAVAIVATSFADGGSAWGQLAPIAVMFAYVGYAVRRSSYSRARVADSAYFLGFLWTLVTLTATVVGKGERISPSDLIGVFAVALSTTATGLFLRTVLIQFERTAGDQEREVADKVDVKVAALISSLESADRQVNAFALAMIRSQNDVLARVREDIVGSLTTFEHAVLEASKRLSQGIETEVASTREALGILAALRTELTESARSRSALITRHTTKVVEQLAEVANVTEKGGRDLRTALNLSADSILKADLPHDALKKRFDELAERCATATAEYQLKLAQSTAALQERVEALAKSVLEVPGHAALTARVTELTSALTTLTTTSDQAREAIQGISAEASTAADHVSTLKTSTAGIAAESVAIAKSLQNATGQIAQAGDQARAVSAELREAVEDASQASQEIVSFVTQRVVELAG